MKKNLLLLSGLLIIIASSCSPDLSEDDLLPFQKKAVFIIENEDFAGTNAKLADLAGNYNGFMKKSSLRRQNGEEREAEFDLRVPIQFFYNYLADVRDEFGGEIIEESIGDEKARSRIYDNTQKELKDVTHELRVFREIREQSSDPDERITAQYQINRLEIEAENLRSKKYSLIEEMNFSNILVKWRYPEKEIIEESLADEIAEFPDEEAIAGLPLIKEIIFDRIGQVEKFFLDEPVRIRFRGLNPQTTDIVSRVDADEGSVTLKTVPYGKKVKIILDKKCQIINVGRGPLPEIETGPGINREQVVITPRVDEYCNHIGFEIRAGTIESGCIEGRKNLARFKNCLKAGKINPGKTAVTAPPERNNILNKEDLFWFYTFPFDE